MAVGGEPSSSPSSRCRVGGRGGRLPERRAAMEMNATLRFPAVGGRDRDVDGTFDGLEQLPERCGGMVAQDCTVTASEHRRHPAAVMAGSAIPYRVDTAVDAVQLPFSHANGDPLRTQA